MDIDTWLRELGLERYEQAFLDNDIAPAVLPELTDQDLKDLGVSLRHRRLLLKAIKELGDSPAEPSSPTDPSPSPPAPTPRLEAERRQLTVLFCDLVGSTELSARLDPEEMSEVIRAYHRGCAGVIGRWDGHVAKYMGDGVLAYFGWPRAHEDDAERAVRAGLALVQTVGRLTTAAGDPLAVRIGIATGFVVVGELVGEGAAQEQSVVGETLNLAARLQALAAPGGVVISQTTRRLVGGLFKLADLGPLRLKGFAEPLAAFQVVGEGRAEGRFEALRGERLTPLVGREHELGILLERWAWAKEGDGQVVLLSGEPGIGKSRLVRALRERLGDQPHTPLSHYCSAYHTNSALYPVIGLLERATGLDRGAAPAAQLARLEAVLVQERQRLDEVVPLLAALLGVPTSERYPALSLTPEVQKRRTLQALVDQLEGLAAQQPVLALYEDVHWIDPSSLELLGVVIERTRRLRVLVLITFRPEFQPPWTGHAHVTTLTMSRLGLRQGADLVARVTGEKPLPANIVEQIVARTDGVPLFVEELTKTVVETGEASVPVSLHDSLMARLDRLPEVKEIAQVAAVLGREFNYAVLAAVANRPASELQAALGKLVQAELIFRRGTLSDARYVFKHALVRDAAYQSLLKARRRQVHARIADAFAGAGNAPPELRALHSARAGRTREAVVLWLEAGRLAHARSAVHEAVAHLRSALDRVSELPSGTERDALELQAQLALAQALLAARSWADPEVGQHFASAGERAYRTGSVEQRIAGLFGAFQYRLNRQEFEIARPLGDEMLRLAESMDDDEARIVGHRSLGVLTQYTGWPVVADRHLRRAVELHDPTQHGALATRYGFEFRSGAMAPLAMSLVCRGRLPEGLVVADEALNFANGLPLRHAWCHTACLTAYAFHFARVDGRFAELAEGCRSLAPTKALVSVAATGTLLGWTYEHAILA